MIREYNEDTQEPLRNVSTATTAMQSDSQFTSIWSSVISAVSLPIPWNVQGSVLTCVFPEHLEQRTGHLPTCLRGLTVQSAFLSTLGSQGWLMYFYSSRALNREDSQQGWQNSWPERKKFGRLSDLPRVTWGAGSGTGAWTQDSEPCSCHGTMWPKVFKT